MNIYGLVCVFHDIKRPSMIRWNLSRASRKVAWDNRAISSIDVVFSCDDE